MKSFKSFVPVTLSAFAITAAAFSTPAAFAQSGVELEVVDSLNEVLNNAQNAPFNRVRAKYNVSNATDDNTSYLSRMAIRNVSLSNPANFIMHLESAQDVGSVGIFWGNAAATDYTFEIWVSPSESDNDWTKVFSGTDTATDDAYEYYDFTPVEARRVRIKLRDVTGAVWIDINEAKVFGTSSAPIEAAIESASSVGEHLTFNASNAIDGDNSWGTRFANRTSPTDLVVTLENVTEIADVDVAWTLGYKRTHDFEILARETISDPWSTVLSRQDSTITPRASNGGAGFERYDVTNMDAKQVLIRTFGNSDNRDWTLISDLRVFGEGSTPTPTPSGQFNLDPNAEPWENFDLSNWKLDTPAGRNSASDCRAQDTQPFEYDDLPTSRSRPFFFTHTDGGMRFVSSIGGGTTGGSCSSFTRSELREMLRGSDTSIDTTGKNGDYRNNWALGYQSQSHNGNNGESWGAREGKMTATLRVNDVTTTGNGLHPGRLVIGQIHANENEPIRLYYRKLPGADRGCIYAEHETHEEASDQDITFNLIGNEKCEGNGPTDGIALDELFSYEIENIGADIFVTIRRGDFNGSVIASTTIDMNANNSGYDRGDDWMYFKAGVYTQNNSGTQGTGDTVTFYRLNVTH